MRFPVHGQKTTFLESPKGSNDGTIARMPIVEIR